MVGDVIEEEKEEEKEEEEKKCEEIKHGREAYERFERGKLQRKERLREHVRRHDSDRLLIEQQIEEPFQAA